LEKARNQLQITTDKVFLDLRKQYLAVVSSRSRIAALDKAVESGKLLVTATEQSIKGGVRINLDLLNARQQLYTSERDLAQARYNYLVASMKMRAAAGTLGADDVRELGNYFR
jgi:protease secretion system outer membrane protein